MYLYVDLLSPRIPPAAPLEPVALFARLEPYDGVDYDILVSDAEGEPVAPLRRAAIARAPVASAIVVAGVSTASLAILPESPHVSWMPPQFWSVEHSAPMGTPPKSVTGRRARPTIVGVARVAEHLCEKSPIRDGHLCRSLLRTDRQAGHRNRRLLPMNGLRRFSKLNTNYCRRCLDGP